MTDQMHPPLKRRHVDPGEAPDDDAQSAWAPGDRDESVETRPRVDGGGATGFGGASRVVAPPCVPQQDASIIDLATQLFTDPSRFEAFVEIQRCTTYQINSLVFSLPASVLSIRKAEVTARGLDDDQMLDALRERKRAVAALIGENNQKVEDSMLQHFRVMTRRKIAVMSGVRLAAPKSLFG